MKPARTSDAGVTLIEMMIALALFALIGSAGFAILDQVLRSQRGLEGRLERLSAQQRALHVVLADFAMAEPHSLTARDHAALSLERSRTGGSLRVGYRLADGILYRDLTATDGTILADQAILSGIDSIRWRFLTLDGMWSDIWPADPTQTLTTPQNPRAVELTMALRGIGDLRRVAPLPADLE